MKTLPQPWTVAIQATIFSGWIYDHLLPHVTRSKWLTRCAFLACAKAIWLKNPLHDGYEVKDRLAEIDANRTNLHIDDPP